MKYVVYCILAFIGLMLFLPKSDSTEIRNLPLLIVIISLLLVYAAYRYIKLIFLAYKVKKSLKKSGFTANKTHLNFRTGYVIAEDDTQVYNVSLLVGKRRYLRYHFSDEWNIEFVKSTASMFNTAGNVAKGATYTRVVGKQKVARCDYNTDKELKEFLVIDKFPNSITDFNLKGELGNGDCICSGNMVLFDLEGFTRHLKIMKADFRQS